MHKQVNQLKMGTILSYVSIGVQNLIAMIYTPVMLRLLGQSEYGLYQLGNSTVAYLGLLSFGFGSSYVRFFYQYKVKNQEEEIRKLNSIFLLVFCTLAAVCIVIGSGLIFSADVLFSKSLSFSEIVEIRWIMVVLVITTALTFPNIILTAILQLMKNIFFKEFY